MALTCLLAVSLDIGGLEAAGKGNPIYRLGGRWLYLHTRMSEDVTGTCLDSLG